MKKLTNLDADQITRYSYDEDNQAIRVVIEGVGIEKVLKEQLKDLKVEIKTEPLATIKPSEPLIVYEPRPFEVEKPVIVYEPKIIEIDRPIVITETKVIEVPKEVEKIIYKEIQVPVIQKEIQIIEIPKNETMFFYVYSILKILLLTGVLVAQLIR